MQRIVLGHSTSFIAMLTLASSVLLGSCATKMKYPEARRADVVDDFHGTSVADPYRWLEESSNETSRWIDAQNVITDKYLAAIPERMEIHKRLEALWSYDKYSLPQRRGGRIFYFRMQGLQDQAVLYVQDNADSEARVLLDPNKLSEDGTTSVSSFQASRDGRYIAYSISQGGSDWRSIKVRDVTSGKDLDDQVNWVKFSDLSWKADGSGFFYSRYDEPTKGKEKLQSVNEFHKLYLHQIGDAQSDDRLVYERRDHAKWGFDGHVSDDGRYLIIHVWMGTSPRNGVFFKDLAQDGEVVELLPSFDAGYHFVHNVGNRFFFWTDLDASRGRLIAMKATAGESIQTIIPESDATLESVDVSGSHFVALYLRDVVSELEVRTMDGKLDKKIELPAVGSIRGISADANLDDFYYSFSSFTYPTTIFRYDVKADTRAVFRRPDVDFDPEDFTVRQVFFRSKDGTRIPMFVVHRKDIELDGKRPTYLYGYGGFNISIKPSFSVANLVWLERGNVYAVPNLRGGGEYGEEWHQAGTKLQKQNVFDDFIAAAEWLVTNNYTSSEHLGIGGRSNGGLLVGACMTQRPDLFHAALPGVGVLDMLRFHKFTIGGAWVSDYGSPENPEEFEALHAYSPYHNVKPNVKYPATLVTTADHDDRVVPAHSYKFTAAMQAAQSGSAPILISIDTKAGHGAGKPTSKVIEEWADNWSFLTKNL